MSVERTAAMIAAASPPPGPNATSAPSAEHDHDVAGDGHAHSLEASGPRLGAGRPGRPARSSEPRPARSRARAARPRGRGTRPGRPARRPLRPRRPTGRRRARRRSGSRRRSACGCSATPATPSRASGAACARRRRPSGRRGPSRSPRRAGRSPRARARGPRPRRAARSARTRGGSARPSARRRRPGSGRRGSRARRPATGPPSARDSVRRRRRTTASTRAISSSGWHGFVSQSSAPEPQAADALGDGRAGRCRRRRRGPAARRQMRSRYSQARGPRTARSTTSALRRIATSSSIGHRGRASTRCSQPSRSRRLPSTCRKPESVSMTATRSGGWPWRDRTVRVGAMRSVHDGASVEPAVDDVAVEARARSQAVHNLTALGRTAGRRDSPGRDGERQPAGVPPARVPSGTRGTGPSDDEHDLLADVDGVVADRARSRARPSSSSSPTRACRRRRRRSIASAEDLAVEAVDLAVLARRGRSASVDVARLEGQLAPATTSERAARAHAQDLLQQLRHAPAARCRQRDQLGDVHALVAHALDVLDRRAAARRRAAGRSPPAPAARAATGSPWWTSR